MAEWLRVKNDPLMRQTFINTVLGEPYEDRGEKALSENACWSAVKSMQQKYLTAWRY